MKPMTEEEKVNKVRNKQDLPSGITKNDNVNYLIHNLDLIKFSPIDCKVEQAEVISTRCFDYVELCMRNAMKPSIAGLALAIGVGRETLLNYINGVTPIPNDNRLVLQKFNGLLNSLMEDYMQNGKINPVTAIFLAKNNFGYKDTQEFVVNNNNQEEASAESLIEEANLLFDGESKMANIEI